MTQQINNHMKILITGANGLLGHKLVRLLGPKREVVVIATARGESRLRPEYGSFQYESMDIANREDVLEIVGRHKPDVIINTAAMTNVDECEKEKEACMQLNVEAVKYLVEAAEQTNAFLLHLSTDFIFSHGRFPSGWRAKSSLMNPPSVSGSCSVGCSLGSR